MKPTLKSVIVAIALFFMLFADVPLLFVPLVPEAEAVLGVRRRTARRTAVVVGSTMEAEQAAAQQQQAAQPAQVVPVGTVVPQLPAGCAAVVVNGVSYSDCGGIFYQAAYQGSNLVYVVVAKPIP